ncbi:unnamed protein product, partial [Lepidochelys kempii]
CWWDVEQFVDRLVEQFVGQRELLVGRGAKEFVGRLAERSEAYGAVGRSASDHARLTGLVLREPELRPVLSAYADDVLLVVQDPGDLVRVEACQAIYSAASSARVNWVKSSGLEMGDWRQ